MKFKGMPQSNLFSMSVIYVIGAVNISWRAFWGAKIHSFAKKNKSLKIKNLPLYRLSFLPIPIPQCFLSCQTLMPSLSNDVNEVDGR